MALLVIILLAVGIFRSCTAPQPEPANTNTNNEIPALSAEEQAALAKKQLEDQHNALLNSIDGNALADLLRAGDANDLINAAKGNMDVAQIAANYQKYGWDGEAVQAKLLRLAANDPMATAYVRDWPNRYPSEAVRSNSYAASATSTSPNVPLLFQWDQRWGYTTYSSASFGLTGCCPTSFCMAYQGLTGKRDLSPADFAYLAEEDGYMDEFNGTNSTWLVNDAEVVGLTCQQIYVESYALSVALENGAVVVCNVGPGDFTDDGHFIVITGYADDGTLTINDPYSSVRSAQTWDVNQVLSQTRALFALYAK